LGHRQGCSGSAGFFPEITGGCRGFNRNNRISREVPRNRARDAIFAAEQPTRKGRLALLCRTPDATCVM